MFVKLIVLNFFTYAEFLKKVGLTVIKVATFDGSKLLKLKRKQLWSEFKIFSKLFNMVNTHRWKTCIYTFRIWIFLKKKSYKLSLNKLIRFIYIYIYILKLFSILYYPSVAHLVQSLQVNASKPQYSKFYLNIE